jgi:hypothetical protein
MPVIPVATPPGRADAAAVPEAPRSTPCPGCSAPVEPGDTFCAACGAAQARPDRNGTPAEAATGVGFKCENCGAELRCEPGTRTTSCPFCAAPYVVEFDPKSSGRQEPEFVLGFAVTPEQAEAIHRAWLAKGGLFRPSDVRHRAELEGLRGIYLPFWSFSLRADSRWSASIGEHWYRTETYTTRDSKGNTVVRTRQVRETEWWPLEGGHHAYYSFYLVSGSRGLPQGVFEWVQPFQLLALKRYAPRYLAGWLSEEYSVEKADAYALTEAEFRRREAATVAAFLPGDTHGGLEVRTEFSKTNSDLILLPVYLRSYRYKGKLYRTLINGQTGKVEGEKPLSALRIGALVAAIILAGTVVGLFLAGVFR